MFCFAPISTKLLGIKKFTPQGERPGVVLPLPLLPVVPVVRAVAAVPVVVAEDGRVERLADEGRDGTGVRGANSTSGDSFPERAAAA